MQSLVCLMGPTAAGKSSLAIEIAERFNFEIISVDSAMVYKGLDIGTAKPSAEILKKTPHALIDIIEPNQIYSAGQFHGDALAAIKNIFSRGKVPLLVGGTMLYFRILLQGLSPMPKADANLRATLKKIAAEKGWNFLHQELKHIDPLGFHRINPRDQQRIQRAMEVFLLTGKSITAWQQANSHLLANYKIFSFALAPAREELQQRIAQRFQQMLELGFMEEALQLFNNPAFCSDLPAMRTVNYRQAWDYFAGKLTYAEMVEKAIIATRQLAKRQMTWLRSFPELTWITDGKEKKEFFQLLQQLTHLA